MRCEAGPERADPAQDRPPLDVDRTERPGDAGRGARGLPRPTTITNFAPELCHEPAVI